MKKVFATLLCLAVMCTGAYGAYYDEGNNGNSWETAYVINSIDDLKLMRDRVNSSTEPIGKYYKLSANIDLSGETNWIPIGKAWSSIPTDNKAFQGHFDGQNNTISVNFNLTAEESEASLFGTVGTNGIAIRNLNINGTVKSTYIASGIVQYLHSGTMENCNFTGTVEANGVSTYAGGLVYGLQETNKDLAIDNCRFSGTVTATASGSNGTAQAAGIVCAIFGSPDGTNQSGGATKCQVLSGSTITASSPNSYASIAGGIVATILNGNVINCNTLDVTVNCSGFCGGIAGTGSGNLTGNSWPARYPEIGTGNIGNNIPENGNSTTTPLTSQDATMKLKIATISPVVLSDEVIAKLAQNISVDPSELILLTSADFDPSEPPEPTNAMRQKVQGQFMAKLNTINVNKDGWYVFMVTVSDDLVGTKVSDLRLYGADASDFTASSFNAAFDLMPIVNGITGGLEISDFFGIKLDTLPKQFLTTMFLSASQSLTVYIVKILLLLLGGCDAGFGVLGGGLMMLVSGILAIRFIKRKRR